MQWELNVGMRERGVGRVGLVGVWGESGVVGLYVPITIDQLAIKLQYSMQQADALTRISLEINEKGRKVSKTTGITAKSS